MPNVRYGLRFVIVAVLIAALVIAFFIDEIRIRGLIRHKTQIEAEVKRLEGTVDAQRRLMEQIVEADMDALVVDRKLRVEALRARENGREQNR